MEKSYTASDGAVCTVTTSPKADGRTFVSAVLEVPGRHPVGFLAAVRARASELPVLRQGLLSLPGRRGWMADAAYLVGEER